VGRAGTEALVAGCSTHKSPITTECSRFRSSRRSVPRRERGGFQGSRAPLHDPPARARRRGAPRRFSTGSSLGSSCRLRSRRWAPQSPCSRFSGATCPRGWRSRPEETRVTAASCRRGAPEGWSVSPPAIPLGRASGFTRREAPRGQPHRGFCSRPQTRVPVTTRRSQYDRSRARRTIGSRATKRVVGSSKTSPWKRRQWRSSGPR
jgi:hypothetical protein